MRITVIADEMQKAEWLTQGQTGDFEVNWVGKNERVPDSECIINLLFSTEDNLSAFELTQEPIYIINDVLKVHTSTSNQIVRINGWNSFLKRSVVEAACENDEIKKNVVAIFETFGKKTEWVPDIIGLLSPRVVATIINEAYHALSEKVSTKEEIDIAMKLGTNYPYGPFEWAEKIGIKNVHGLLLKLSQTNPRYTPSILLTNEVNL